MNIPNMAVNALSYGFSGAVGLVFPSHTTISTIGTSAMVGGALAGLPGLALGVVAGVLISPLANKAVDTIGVGTGKVSNGIKQCFNSATTLVKHTIYRALESVYGWLARWSDTSDWAKSTYTNADQAYLQKMEKSGQNLAPLLQPIKGGVADQANIIQALTAQAVKSDQPVTEKEIIEWVSLGERLVDALAQEKSTIKHGKLVQVAHPSAENNPIAVESSLYTVRAVTWYITAQALWHDSLRENPNEAEAGTQLAALTKKIMESSTFVLPDQGGRLFTFINQVPSKYTTAGNLLNKQTRLQEALNPDFDAKKSLTLPAIDDGSRHLPGGAKRLIANALQGAQDDSNRIVIQLQALPGTTNTGQRSEGHEPLSWQALQVTTGFATKVMSAVDDWKPEVDNNDALLTLPLTEQQIRHQEIHQKLRQLLEQFTNNDKVEERYEKLSQLPLLALLQLFAPENAARTKEQDILHLQLLDIGVDEYNTFKETLIKAVIEDAGGTWEDELLRESNEIYVPIHLKTEEAFKQHIDHTKQQMDTRLAIFHAPRLSLAQEGVNGGIKLAVAAAEITSEVAKMAVKGVAALTFSAWNTLWGKAKDPDPLLAEPPSLHEKIDGDKDL